MPRLSKSEFACLAGAIVLCGAGGYAIFEGLQAHVTAAVVSQEWAYSPDARLAERQQSAPTPVWLPTPAPAVLVSRADARPTAVPDLPSNLGLVVPAPTVAAAPGGAITGPVQLVGTGFMFLDPPEPGARAEFWLDVAPRDDRRGGASVGLTFSAAWLEGYRLSGYAPDILETRAQADGRRTLIFPRLPAGVSRLKVDVLSTAEVTDPPKVQVMYADGGSVGEAQPRTVAPPPRPGPVSGLAIPRLSLHTSVVQTKWDPPPFVAGQIKNTANVTLGNTVLVGHLTGAAGAVFANLEELSAGDQIVVSSRGVDYPFVVTETDVLPADDTSLMAPVDSARLTLMTCTGDWDPLSHNFSDRLWVVAQPPDQAAATIASGKRVVRLPVPPPTPEPVTEDAPLGGTRDRVSQTLGTPLGETPGKLVLYRKSAIEYGVGFSPDPATATSIRVSAPGSTPLTLSAAIAATRDLFPSDTYPRTPAPEGNDRFVVERFESASLAAVDGDGQFVVVYLRGAGNTIDRAVVATGDDVPAALALANQPQ
jgi:LPXTG-site transpeptidase (sortase) family protein